MSILIEKFGSVANTKYSPREHILLTCPWNICLRCKVCDMIARGNCGYTNNIYYFYLSSRRCFHNSIPSQIVHGIKKKHFTGQSM